VSHEWISTAPVLHDFSEVADPGRYASIPGDWVVGVTDVISSTIAIEAGRYKDVNLAGASAISAVGNALNGDLPLFAFGGDGARFAVPPEHAETAADALSRVAMWVKRDLGLGLRVGMVKVSDVHAAGHDIRVAFWEASENIRYAMFNAGGLEWVEAELKRGAIGLAPAAENDEPDLTGLSCLWGPIIPKKGKIASLIVKKSSDARDEGFAETTSAIVRLLESEGSLNPVPSAGPDVRWSPSAMSLQARVAQPGRSHWRRRMWVRLSTALIWAMFRFNIPIPGFDPARYRQEIPANTDFRKFDDGLMMTVRGQRRHPLWSPHPGRGSDDLRRVLRLFLEPRAFRRWRRGGLYGGRAADARAAPHGDAVRTGGDVGTPAGEIAPSAVLRRVASGGVSHAAFFGPSVFPAVSAAAAWTGRSLIMVSFSAVISRVSL
jgi:hypothetical protein